MSPLRILYLAPRIPQRPFDGGAHSIYHQLIQLRKAGHHVTLGITNTSRHATPHEEAAILCDQLVAVDIDTSITAWGALSSLIRDSAPASTSLPKLPYSLRRFLSAELYRRLVDVLKQEAPFDVIHVDYLPMAWYAIALREHLPQHHVPILFRAHNVEYRILELTGRDRTLSAGARWYYRLLAAQTRRYETAVANRVDAVATVSEPDAAVYRTMAPDTTVVAITPGMDVPPLVSLVKGAHQRPRLGVLGSLEWKPNIEGVQWVVREVLPLILRKRPDVEVHIAGRAPGAEVMELHTGDSVIVHGEVESATDFLATLDVSMVPVLSGSGIRIKILEGLAHQRAMVATTLGAEGINVQHGRHLLIADGAEAFANACLELISDPQKATTLAEQGRGLIEERYSWEAATDALVDLYSSIALRR